MYTSLEDAESCLASMAKTDSLSCAFPFVRDNCFALEDLRLHDRRNVIRTLDKHLKNLGMHLLTVDNIVFNLNL